MTLQKRNITVEKAKSEQYSQILQKKKKKKRENYSMRTTDGMTWEGAGEGKQQFSMLVKAGLQEVLSDQGSG